MSSRVRKAGSILIIIALLQASSAAAAEFAPSLARSALTGVAVYPFTAKGEASPEAAEALTALFTNELAGVPGIRVIGEDLLKDLDSQLGVEQQRGSSDSQIDMAKIAKADLLIRGDLVGIGNDLFLTLQVVELASGGTVLTDSLKSSKAHLADQGRELARKLAREFAKGEIAAVPLRPRLLVYGLGGSPGPDSAMTEKAVAQNLARWINGPVIVEATEQPGFKPKTRCRDYDCAASAAFAAQAQEFMAVSFAPAATGTLVSVRFKPSAPGKESRKAEEVIAGSPDLAAKAAVFLGLSLVADTRKLPAGQLMFDSLPAGSEILIDSTPAADAVAETTTAGAVTGNAPVPVTSGIRNVQIQAEGYEPFESTYVILPGESVSISPHLKAVAPVRPKPAVVAATPAGASESNNPAAPPQEPEKEKEEKPFYKSWWFWAVVTAVAGGTAGGIAAANSGRSSGRSVTFEAPAP